MTEHGPDPITPDEPAAPHQPGTKPRTIRRRGNGGRPPAVKRAPRGTKAEVELRIGVVVGLIVQGICRRRDILRTLARMGSEGKIDWGDVKPRTVDGYMQRATDELAKIADEPRSLAKAKVRAAYQMAMAGASSAKQWDVVRKVARDLARLDGLEPGVRVNVGGSIDANVSGSVEHTHTHRSGSLEERSNRLTELFSLAQQRRAAGQLPTIPAAATNASDN